MKSKLESLFILIILVLSVANIGFCADAINKLNDNTEKVYISQSDIQNNQYLVTDEYISKISPKTTVEAFMMQLNLKDKDAIIYEDENKELEVTDGLVKTGMVMSVKSVVKEESAEDNISVPNTEEVEKTTNETSNYVEEEQTADYTLSVIGDINNDGMANIIEVVQIINHLAGFEGKELVGISSVSGDVNGDNEVNLIDIDKLIRYIVFDELEIGDVNAPKEPTIEIIGEAINGWYKEDTKVIIKTEEEKFLKTVYEIDGEILETAETEKEITIKQEGKHEIKAYTYGQEGNRSTSIIKEMMLDKTAPVLEIKSSKTEKRKMMITVDATDELSGLAEEAYSFDGGNTWQKENSKEYTESQGNIEIKVRDNAGNIATKGTNIEIEKEKYIILFKNYDGTILQEETLEDGTMPEYKGEIPTREEDNTYTYEFKGWDKEIVPVEGNTEYIATYTETYKNYTITFKNEDGTELSRKEDYHYGDTIEVPEAPAKEEEGYTYTFEGWTIDGENIVEVDKTVIRNREYTIKYKKEVNKYTIVFKNYDGTELQKEEVEYGTIPEYKGEIPTREQDNTYTYEFKGWDKEVTNATGDVEYTATYKETYKNYIIVFKNEDGTELSRKEDYHYGDTIKAPETPTKEEAGYICTFKGWTIDGETTVEVDKTVIQNREYVAMYEKALEEYTITYNLDGGELAEGESNPTAYTIETETFTLKNPSKEKYVFAGWTLNDEETSNTEVTIQKGSTGNRTYTANWVAVDTVQNLNTGKKYPSIKAAIEDEEFENGNIIQIITDNLAEDITINEGIEVTIDLNGNTLTNKKEGTTITNNGTLTILDRSTNKEGTVTNTSNSVITNNGTLILGQKDNEVIDTPHINGKEIGLTNNGTFKFYDGRIEGTTALTGTGTIEETEANYSATIEATDGRQNLTLTVLADRVARVEDTKFAYASLNEAIDTLRNEEGNKTTGTITLLKDIVITGEIVIPEYMNLKLDLNGNKIETGSHLFENNGTVEITDNSEEKTGIITSASATKLLQNNKGATLKISGGNLGITTNRTYNYLINNLGELNITSGNLKASGELAACIKNMGTTNINGGTVAVEGYRADAIDNYGTLNVYGGSVSNSGGYYSYDSWGGNAISNAQNSKVTLIGGTITASRNGIRNDANGTVIIGVKDGSDENINISGNWNALDNFGILTIYSGTITKGIDTHGELIVNGGNIDVSGDSSIYNTEGRVEINGGTISSTSYVINNQGNGTVEINEGVISSSSNYAIYNYAQRRKRWRPKYNKIWSYNKGRNNYFNKLFYIYTY